MKRCKKCNRNKAFFGALINGAISTINTILSNRQASQQAAEQSAFNRNQAMFAQVNNLANSYNQSLGNSQDIYKELNKSVTKYGGKKMIKKNIGGYVPTINSTTLNLKTPTLEDYLQNSDFGFKSPDYTDIGYNNYQLGSNPPTTETTDTSSNFSSSISSDIAGGVVGGLFNALNGYLSRDYANDIFNYKIIGKKAKYLGNNNKFVMPTKHNNKISNVFNTNNNKDIREKFGGKHTVKGRKNFYLS